MGSKKERPKKKGGGIFRKLILVLAIGIFCYSAYQLVTIYLTYKQGRDEYEDLQQYVKVQPQIKPAEKTDGDTGDDKADDPADSIDPDEADKPIPPDVDFASLKAINNDVVGWLLMGAVSISYPIVQGEDNDYYLHRTTERTYHFAGSIFLDYTCKADFQNCNSIVYGHNMKDTSMFGKLQLYREQSTLDSDPSFWICTPKKAYRYRIFSVYVTERTSDTYTFFSKPGKEFTAWMQKMQSISEVTSPVELDKKAKIVTLSTCTSNEATRCVVQGVRDYETDVQ